MKGTNRKDFFHQVDKFIEINFKSISDDLEDQTFLTAISNISVLKNWLDANHIELSSDDWRVLLRHNKSLFDNALKLREKDINLSEPHQTLKNLVKEFATDIDTSYNLNNVLNTLNDSLDSYGDSISKIPILNARLEQKLLQGIMNKDPKARELLILYNLRLAYSFALRFRKSNCSLEDLVQESNMGLIQAADHFDATMNVKFPTYATYWMQNYVYNYFADMGRGITLPRKISILYNSMIKTINSLSSKLNREPTAEEIMEALDITPEIYQLLKIRASETISLNSPVSELEGGVELQDIISSNDEPFDDIIVDSMVTEDVFDVLESSNLTNREKEFLLRYFGLNGYKKETLQAIGLDNGLTREGVSGVIKRAIKKIIVNPETDKLLIYSDNPAYNKERLDEKRIECIAKFGKCNMLIHKIYKYLSKKHFGLEPVYPDNYQDIISYIQEGLKARQILALTSISIIDLYLILKDIDLINENYKNNRLLLIKKYNCRH